MRPEVSWQLQCDVLNTRFPRPQTVASHSRASCAPKALTKGKTKEGAKDTGEDKGQAKPSATDEMEKTKRYTLRWARPSLIPLPPTVHLPACLPLHPSPEGLGDYPSHPRVPQESQDRQGGARIVKEQPHLPSPGLLPITQLLHPPSQNSPLPPEGGALSHEVEAGLYLTGVAQPACVVIHGPYPVKEGPDVYASGQELVEAASQLLPRASQLSAAWASPGEGGGGMGVGLPSCVR